MVIDDMNLIKNVGMLFEKKLVLYGAGAYGDKIYNMVKDIEGIDVYCYCETDAEGWKQRHGTGFFNGISVKGIDEVKREVNAEDIMFILSVQPAGVKELMECLQKAYGEIKKVYTWFGIYASVELNIQDERFSEDFRSKVLMLRDCKRKTKFLDGIANVAYKLVNGNPILVWQVGKVGSTSICNTLKNYNIDNVHIHHIGDYNEDKYGYCDEIKKLFCRWKEKESKEKNIKIISMVREPIVRSISQYMESFREDFVVSDHIISDTMEGIKQFIYHDMNDGECGHVFQWFKDEIERIFAIDIYKYPFDKEKGYTIIKEKNVEILLLTLESLNSNIQIIGDFVGVPEFKLVNKNIGEDKYYSHVYREVLDKIVIDKEVIDFYYAGNKGMDYFYSDEQKETLKNRWI